MSSEQDTARPKRWYDHDPLLIEVLETLRSFKEELRVQSQIFLNKITEEVGQEAVNRFYEKALAEFGDKRGRRWYDQDPVVSKAVELLRVVPPEVQRKAAMSFLQGLKDQGIQVPSTDDAS
jgi:hypothetical protein